MEISIKFSDFQKICRICLEEKNYMKPIFKSKVPEMLSSFTTIKIHEEVDILPHLICLECLTHVKNCYDFKKQCENNNQKLEQAAEARLISETYTDCEVINPPIYAKKDSKNKFTDSLDNNSERLNKKSIVIKNKILHKKKRTFNRSKLLNKLSKNQIDENKIIEKNRVCEICNKVLLSSRNLERHMRIHSEGGGERYSCEICGKGFSFLSAQAVHMRRHKVKPISCTACNKQFLLKLQLDVHMMKAHSNEPSIICALCGKGFSQLNKLERHKLTHQSIRPYSCDLCDSKFKHSYSLKHHHKTIHQGVKRKKDVCKICGLSVSYLKPHILAKHSNERPYNCEECGACFVTNSLLNIHIRSKHKGELVFNALCSVCGKQCHSSTALEIHMRTHTKERPFKCSTCGKGFMSAGALKVHVRSHTGERPYRCATCGKAFTTSQLLKVHNRIHTGERPYTCNVCEQTFRQRCVLVTHMKLH